MRRNTQVSYTEQEFAIAYAKQQRRTKRLSAMAHDDYFTLCNLYRAMGYDIYDAIEKTCDRLAA